MKLEKEVKREIYDLMERLECCQDILFFERLQSGVIEHHGNYIWCCREGTPDMFCVFKNKVGGLTTLFIEIKREGIPARPRKGAQQEWKDRYGDLHTDLIYMIAQSAEEVNKKIRHFAFNRLDALKF